MRQRKAELHVINVGHGNSTLIVSPSGETTLIDTGDPVVNQPESFDVTVSDSQPDIDVSINKYERTMVEEYFDQLSDQGYDAFSGDTHRLDNLVISHPDSDHNEYAPELVGRCDVGTVHTSPFLRAQGDEQRQNELAVKIDETNTRFNELREGDTLPITGVEGKVIGPADIEGWNEDVSARSGTVERGGESNRNSLIFSISYGRNDVLVPGDASGEAIREACDRHGVVPNVVIPTHGMGGGDNFVHNGGETELAYPDRSLQCAIGSYRRGKLDLRKNEIDVFAQRAVTLNERQPESRTDGHPTPDQRDTLDWEQVERIRTDIEPSPDHSEGHSL
jgi:hypothetical protein